MSLAEAREKAKACRQLLLEGKDPIAEKRARKAEAAKQITFAAAAQTFIADHHAGWKNPKNRQQWEGTLATYAYPVIGKLPVNVIDTNLVMRGAAADLARDTGDGEPGAHAGRARPRLGHGARL